MTSHLTLRRIALAVVGRYPAAWRERYGSEVAGLIDDSQLRWRDVAELVRGMFAERARELVETTERRKRTAFVLWLIRWAFGAAFVGSVFATALALRGAIGQPAEDAAVWMMLNLFTVLAALLIYLWRIRTSPPFGPQPPYPASAAFTLLPAYFVLLTTMVWVGAFPIVRSILLPGWFVYLPSLQNWMWLATIAVGLAGALLPGRELLFTLAQLAGSDDALRSAQQFVDGCRDMISKGVPSPLADAEAALERTRRAQAEARERLYALGYRARFREPIN